MNGENLWRKIVAELAIGPVETATVPSNNKEPSWFIVYLEEGIVYVDNAKIHKPSTKMSQRRRISEKDFLAVYPYYHRWANGERNSKQEAIAFSQNTAYIFALIAKFE
jgi:hypothetical protein